MEAPKLPSMDPEDLVATRTLGSENSILEKLHMPK
jgi:hypothetical protein